MSPVATVTVSRKACSVNPLKMSQPIGGALAFLGLDRSVAILHGSQGCTSFGLVLFVRHFREPVPMQTTAMTEVTTVLGGAENIEEAILAVAKRAQPAVIGLCTTGLTETQGEDVLPTVREVQERHPELGCPVVAVSTPDFVGAFQDGWSRAVTRMVEELAEGSAGELPKQVTVLASPSLTPADVEAIGETVAAFGLSPILLPDLSASLDGHVADDFSPVTTGGTTLEALRAAGRSAFTLALGESMRPAAQALQEKCGVPFTVFPRLTGLEACDRFVDWLRRFSGRDVPVTLRRQRSRLVDAMLDGHFFFGRKRVAVGAEPDLLYALTCWLAEMGCEVAAAVTTTASAVLEQVPAAEVLIGDLEDLEERARGCDLLVTHSHGRQASGRLGIPLLRVGIPVFDRLGAAHQRTAGYEGTLRLLFEAGNLLIAHMKEPEPHAWARGGAA